ncbi:MFS transporter [Erysipelotrichaceae bacterium RD49]|nr:MFS transporter [Erysipelotrichaceae bacterium RD49]
MANNTSQLYPPAITDDPAAASSFQSEVNLKSSLKEKWNLKGSYFSYFLAFSFYYMGLSLFSALISVYLIGLGFSAGQASLVVSVSFLASMAVQPFIGTTADHYGSKQVSVWLFMGASLGGIVFLFCRSLWMLMAFYSLVMVLLNGANPIIEKMATNSPYAYGKIRVWGTIGAALGTQHAGYLYDRVSPSSIFIAFVVSMLIGLYGTRLTADTDLNDSSKQMDPANTPKTKPGMLSLLGNRKYLYYLVVYGLFMGGTATGNTFIPSLFTSLGLPASMASPVLSLAIMTQLPLVLYAGKFMSRMTNKLYCALHLASRSFKIWFMDSICRWQL